MTEKTTRILSRRDFIKLAGVAFAVAATSKIKLEAEAQGIPTSIIKTDQKIVDEFITKIAEPKNILPEQISAFTIKVGFASWDFFAIAPTETTNTEGQIILDDEQLFIRDVVYNLRGAVNTYGVPSLTTPRYVPLYKDENDKGADKITPLTTWSMKVTEPRPDKDPNDTKFEKILWYPQITEEQWQIVAKDKDLSNFFGFMGFLPPSTTIGLFSNWGLERETIDVYDPKTGKTVKKEAFTYPIDLANELPDESKRSLIKRERVKVPPPETLVKMKEWQERLGENYEVRTDGTIWDKKNGLQLPGINWEKGTWTYEFDGNPDFTIPVTARSLWPQKDVNGNITGIIEFVHLGWMWDSEKGIMVREEFQGDPVYSKFESDAFMANPDNVDLTQRGIQINQSPLDPLITTYMRSGAKLPQIVARDLKVSIKSKILPENIIPVPDNKGGWIVVETTTFLMCEMAAHPYTIMIYRRKNGKVDIMLIDRDDIVPEEKLGHPEWEHPTGLSEYYKDHETNLQY